MNRNVNEQSQYDVSSRIIFYRTQKGFSTNKLANLAGISQSYLRDIELGNKIPTVEIIFLLCGALGISMSQFFSDDYFDELTNDPLMQQIYKLSTQQKKTLLEFLKSF